MVNPGGRLCRLRESARQYSMQAASRLHAKFPRGSLVAYRDKGLPRDEAPVFALGTWPTPVCTTRSEGYSRREDPYPGMGSASFLPPLHLK